MPINLSEIRNKTVSVAGYLENLEQPLKNKFFEVKNGYDLDRQSAEYIKQNSRGYMAIVFSASWCKDCLTSIPILSLLSESTGLEVRVFGNLKKDPLSSKRKWRIPPSPIEVESFNVNKIPLIVIVDKNGIEIGRIVEKPQLTFSLEREISEIVKHAQ